MKLRATILVSLISVAVPQCSICGEGKEVTNPDAIFEFPSQPPVSCGTLEDAGLSGLIPLELCPATPPLVDTICGCEEIGGGTPTDPPITGAPAGPPAANTPAPTAPTVSPGPTDQYTPVLIQIIMGSYAAETGWSLQDASGTAVAGVPVGGYESRQDYESILEEISLETGAGYTLTMLDGSSAPGFYTITYVYLGSEPDTSQIIGFYDPYYTPAGASHTLTFLVSPDGILDNINPTPTPSVSPSGEPSAPTVSEAPSSDAMTVLLVLTLDNFPYETGWRIETSKGFVVHEVETGTYSGFDSGRVITEQIDLPTDINEYLLVLVDSFGDGLDTPAILYLGDVEDPGNVLAYYDGLIGSFSERGLPFQLDQPLVGLFPTASPTSPAPTPSPGPHGPCNICGNNTAAIVMNPDGIFDYTADISLRCGELEEHGTQGMISSTFCATLPALLNETCACM